MSQESLISKLKLAAYQAKDQAELESKLTAAYDLVFEDFTTRFLAYVQTEPHASNLAKERRLVVSFRAPHEFQAVLENFLSKLNERDRQNLKTGWEDRLIRNIAGKLQNANWGIFQFGNMCFEVQI